MSVERPPEGGAEHWGEEAWQRLLTFGRMLEEQGNERGLIGPRELERLWSRHILNSAAPIEWIPRDAKVGDVGSGAGFPGVVIAILRPDAEVTLIESMERRTEWLREVRKELKLKNLKIRQTRAEDLRGHFLADVVTARAVANLKKLLPWVMPLLRPGGSLLALKGKRAGEEIDAAGNQLRAYKAAWADVYPVMPFGTDEETFVVEVRKLG
ncbi:16S rRNA (guanine(527)-N(7))-methyltransferase RsmG [Neoactinobaculum massilliense]|uniref:16S rRNA (guanine(527)-N(7))-methyltransferase RsmG n=1 Tax=Neoactinobaculum massilliense TaxID=2364794 RepID=UPI001F151462|nr:16S rRNA (guanine(527)-N(7))-methyltransferase RsmG [Neoactinobaculum massilliense]